MTASGGTREEGWNGERCRRVGFWIGKGRLICLGDEKRTERKRSWRREGCRDHNAIEMILGRKGLKLRHRLARPYWMTVIMTMLVGLDG